MFEILILLWFLSLIWIFFDVLKIKKSYLEAFVYLIGALLLWIIIFPYWIFYEKRKILNKNRENKIESKVKSKFKCSDCGEMVNDNEDFCSNCGTSFEDEDIKKCEKCNHSNKKDSKFCSKCGNKHK